MGLLVLFTILLSIVYYFLVVWSEVGTWAVGSEGVWFEVIYSQATGGGGGAGRGVSMRGVCFKHWTT